jgi:hypothetical protein
MHPCDHAEYHSAQTRYAVDAARLRYVVVCDSCGAVVRELGSAEYRPEPRLDIVPPRPPSPLAA